MPEFFNDNQKVGLELYHELLLKIPRSEVEEVTTKVHDIAKNLSNGREVTALTCGSYRRGREMCGDIDILMTFEDGGSHKGYLQKLVDELMRVELVTHSLVITSDEIKRKHESSTFEGIAKLEGGIHRRLDIKIYPRKFYA